MIEDYLVRETPVGGEDADTARGQPVVKQSQQSDGGAFIQMGQKRTAPDKVETTV